MKISRLIVLAVSITLLFTAILPHGSFAIEGITTLSDEPVTATEGDFTYIAVPKKNPKYILITAYNGDEEKIVIPETLDGYPVRALSSFVFKECKNLTYVKLPKSISNVSGETFAECRSLTRIEVDPENTSYTSEKGILYNIDKTALVAYPNGIEGDFTVPGSVVSIGAYAFCGAYMLENVTMSNNVTGIYESAFEGCFDLKSIRLSDNLSLLGEKALANCLDLREIHLPGSLQVIGADAILGHLNSANEKEYFFTNGVYCVKNSKAYDYVYKLGIRAPYLKTEERTLTDLSSGIKLIDHAGILPMEGDLRFVVTPVASGNISPLIPVRFEKIFSYKINLTLNDENYTPNGSLILQFNGLPEGTVTTAAKVYRTASSRAYELVRSPHTPFVGAQITKLGTYSVITNSDFSTLGDPDGDGIVTSYDARFALCIAAGLVTDVTEEQFNAANPDNSDNGVTTDDAINILRYAAGIIDTFEE